MPRFLAPAFVIALAVAVGLVAQQPAGGKKIALLVGVQRYGEGTSLRNLDYTEKDVDDLRAVLEKQGYDVTTLTLTEETRTGKGFFRPTAKNVRNHLAAMTKDRRAEDTVLVAFSGHGAHLKETDKLYFCPQDTDLKDERSLVAIDDVMAALDGKVCKAGAKVLIMDACRNDPADGKSGGTPDGLKSVTRPLLPDLPGGTVALFSCSKGQISHESATLKRGFLFHHVIEGLGGKAAGKSGEVTWLGLAKYVEDELPTSVRKEKGPTVVQTPEVRGDSRQLVLARVSTGKERKGGEEVEFEIADGVKMTFCWIPPGEAQLGSPKAERDYIVNSLLDGKTSIELALWLGDQAEGARGKYVEKIGFWLGKYPVTQQEWTAVMGTTPFAFHRNGTDAGYVNRVAGLDTARFPAERVSWDDSQEFLKAVNKRQGTAIVFGAAGKFALPHEDRWEYANRGGKGNKTAFYWGDELNGDKANCDGNSPYGTTTKGKYLERPSVVGSYAKAAPHPWGLCDMSGNVQQWCDNKDRVDQITYCVRGGSWDFGAWLCRAAGRTWGLPNNRTATGGLRVIFSID